MKKNRLLKIENLHVTINENEILKGLDLEINEGEIHVLMGTNGTGKSTLVKTLSGHYDCVVNEGKITYKNKDLLEMDVSTRANEEFYEFSISS
jgi:Fe-S cluster assembly ATP-binding protein